MGRRGERPDRVKEAQQVSSLSPWARLTYCHNACNSNWVLFLKRLKISSLKNNKRKTKRWNCNPVQIKVDTTSVILCSYHHIFCDYPWFKVFIMKHFCKRLPERKMCQQYRWCAILKGFEEWVPCCLVLDQLTCDRWPFQMWVIWINRCHIKSMLDLKVFESNKNNNKLSSFLHQSHVHWLYENI